jgi:F-type H+-transporting ATPase subunit epsilon
MATFEIPKKILLNIVTPERSLVSEQVDEVVLPGVEGYLGALPGHTPLLTSLKIGEIKYRSAGGWRYLAVSWGFVEILPDRVTVLADVAEKAEEIDVERAKRKAESAKAELRDPDKDFLQAQIALEHSLVRMQVAAKAAPLPK